MEKKAQRNTLADYLVLRDVNVNLDDVEDKTRRNLMAYCTAIIASTVFDLSITHNVLGISLTSNAPPWVGLACLGAVLGYLLVRFALSPKVAKAYAEWLMDHRQKVAQQQLHFVSKELRAAIFLKAPPKGLKITSNQLPPTHTVLADDPTPLIEWRDERSGIFLGSWATAVENSREGSVGTDVVHQPVYFKLSKTRQFVYAWQLMQARYRLDWPSLELGFPILMTFAAAGCLAWKTYTAYPCFGLIGMIRCSM